MALSNDAVKRLMIATTSAAAGNEVATAINDSAAVVAQSGVSIVAAIVATSTSTTTDFAALKVGDVVLEFGAVAGTTLFHAIVTAGTMPAAATIGSCYVVLRTITLPADSNVKF